MPSDHGLGLDQRDCIQNGREAIPQKALGSSAGAFTIARHVELDGGPAHDQLLGLAERCAGTNTLGARHKVSKAEGPQPLQMVMVSFVRRAR